MIKYISVKFLESTADDRNHRRFFSFLPKKDR